MLYLTYNKYAITGAAGFIGRHVAVAFINRGYKVVLIDVPHRLRTREEFVGELSNIGYGLKRAEIGLMELRPRNLSDGQDTEEVLDGCDAVVHLAGLSNPRKANQEPDIARRINVDITIRLLNAGRYFVLASSYLLYKPRETPFKANEETPVEADLPPYEQSKFLAERAVSELGNNLVCRFANNYGPGQAHGFLVPDATQRIMSSQGQVEIFDPESVRDFIFVRDTAAGLATLVEKNCAGVFNIGSGEGHTIRQVYDIIKNRLGRPALEYLEKSNTIRFLVADVGKIKRAGWQPSISLEEGIERTLRQNFH